MCPTIVWNMLTQGSTYAIVFLTTIVLNQTKHVVQYSVITIGMGWVQYEISNCVVQRVLPAARKQLIFEKRILGGTVEMQNVHLVV